MSDRLFEWDPRKADANKRKHSVSFGEATTVFDDPNVRVEHDDRHSTDEEERRLAIWISSRLGIIAVSYTVRRYETIRIISARRATKAEVGRYDG